MSKRVEGGTMRKKKIWDWYKDRFWTPCIHTRQCVGLCPVCIEEQFDLMKEKKNGC